MRYGRKIFFATLCLCLLLSTAVYYFYHVPLQRELVQLRLDRRRTAQLVVDILNFRNEHGDLDDYLLALDEQRAVIDRALPEQLSQGEFIDYLQRTALEHKIRLLSISPGSVEKTADARIVRLPIRILIECSYFTLLDFLKSLEDGERLICMENFSVASTDWGDSLRCELNLVLFALDGEGNINAEIFDGG